MISSLIVFLVACAYSLASVIPGGLDAASTEAMVSRAMGPLIAAVAALSAFPSTRVVRFANVFLGVTLFTSPLAFPTWSPTALVIHAIVGLWVTGFTLLPRGRDLVMTGGGWRHVLSSPSTIDRIETAAGL
ncbi:MAG: hypothetical protein V4760_10340 [Bdellovibrionota bacterium]